MFRFSCEHYTSGGNVFGYVYKGRLRTLSLNGIARVMRAKKWNALCLSNEKGPSKTIVTSLRHSENLCTKMCIQSFGAHNVQHVSRINDVFKKYEFIFHFNFVDNQLVDSHAKWSMQISCEIRMEMKIILFPSLSVVLVSLIFHKKKRIGRDESVSLKWMDRIWIKWKAKRPISAVKLHRNESKTSFKIVWIFPKLNAIIPVAFVLANY